MIVATRGILGGVSRPSLRGPLGVRPFIEEAFFCEVFDLGPFAAVTASVSAEAPILASGMALCAGEGGSPATGEALLLLTGEGLRTRFC